MFAINWDLFTSTKKYYDFLNVYHPAFFMRYQTWMHAMNMYQMETLTRLHTNNVYRIEIFTRLHTKKVHEMEILTRLHTITQILWPRHLTIHHNVSAFIGCISCPKCIHIPPKGLCVASGVSMNFLVREGGKFMNFRQGGSISDKMPKISLGGGAHSLMPPCSYAIVCGIDSKIKNFCRAFLKRS